MSGCIRPNALCQTCGSESTKSWITNRAAVDFKSAESTGKLARFLIGTLFETVNSRDRGGSARGIRVLRGVQGKPGATPPRWESENKKYIKNI